MSSEYGETAAADYTASLTTYHASGRVLDVGCATGNNALYFARRGYEVDALDVDGKALEALAQKATEINVSLNLIHEDIATFEPAHQYDIVLADRSLYFLPSFDAFKAAVAKLQDATALSGVHSNTVFDDENKVDPGPRLTMGMYGMMNLYINNPNWEKRHMWWTTDPLGQKFVTIIAQKTRE